LAKILSGYDINNIGQASVVYKREQYAC